MSKQKLFLLILSLIGFISLSYILISTDNKKSITSTISSNTNQTKLNIVTTLFPLYDITKSVPNSNQVKLLLPPGIEAHSFEPTPLNIQTINDSDVFIYAGEEMEPWAKEIIKSMDKKPLIVDVSQGITFLELNEEKDVHNSNENTDHNNESEDIHEHSKDPHFWLDFDNTKLIVETIKTNLENKDPKNTTIYEENANRYKEKLSELDDSFKIKLNSCSTRSLVHGGHYAFGYLANRYGLAYNSAQGFTPDSEPSSQDIIKLVEIIKNSNAKAVFTEELVDPKIANLISTETGVPVRKISTGSNITKTEFEQNITFFDIMNKNLNELELGLGCK